MMQSDSSVFSSIQAVAGSPYNKSEYNRDVLKFYLLRKARQMGVRLPTGTQPEVFKYLGAFVETPTAGMNENVVYCDLASLYPNNIITLNASPETIVGTKDELEASQYTEDDCVWGYIDPRPVKHIDKGESWRQYTDGEYKMVYDPETPSVKWTTDEDGGPQYEKLYFLSHDTQLGFLTQCVDDLIQLKEQYRGTPLYAATKAVVNSVYGIVGFATQNTASSIYDWRLAEAITLTGRKIIQHSRDTLIERLQQQGYDNVYACSGDTDATALSLPTGSTKDQILRDVNQAVEWLNTEGYDQFAQQQLGVSPNHREIEIEIESFAPRLFIPSQNPPHGDVGVKKRYIQYETWNDDDGDCNEISITGLEAERSDVAPITKTAQQVFAETLKMDNSIAREKLYPQLREFATSIQNGSMELGRACKRKGIGQNLNEYGSSTRRAGPIYRGAKYTNENIEGTTLQHGDKPSLVYVDKIVDDSYPTTYSATTAEDGDVVDAIALPDASMLPEGFVVDWDKHLQKSLVSPMEPLLATRFGTDPWSEIIHGHEQSGLTTFTAD